MQRLSTGRDLTVTTVHWYNLPGDRLRMDRPAWRTVADDIRWADISRHISAMLPDSLSKDSHPSLRVIREYSPEYHQAHIDLSRNMLQIPQYTNTISPIFDPETMTLVLRDAHCVCVHCVMCGGLYVISTQYPTRSHRVVPQLGVTGIPPWRMPGSSSSRSPDNLRLLHLRNGIEYTTKTFDHRVGLRIRKIVNRTTRQFSNLAALCSWPKTSGRMHAVARGSYAVEQMASNPWTPWIVPVCETCVPIYTSTMTEDIIAASVRLPATASISVVTQMIEYCWGMYHYLYLGTNNRLSVSAQFWRLLSLDLHSSLFILLQEFPSCSNTIADQYIRIATAVLNEDDAKTN